MMNSALDDPVAVIGAGPAGLLTASMIKHVDVVVYEARRRLGYPPHCTGIVSPSTARLIGVDEAVEARYECAAFLDSSLRERCRVCSRPLAVKLSRPLLEEVLAERVRSRGHRVFLGERVVYASRGGEVYTTTAKHRHGAIVVADGAGGRIAGTIAGRHKCEYLLGLEVRVVLSKRVDDAIFYTVHGTSYAPRFFAWMTPVSGGREAVVGLASSQGIVEKLSRALRLFERRGLLSVSGIVSKRSGRIVRGPPRKRVVYSRAAIIGDAACASKPFTGGGLYSIASTYRVLAESIDRGVLEDYQHYWSLFIREIVAQRSATIAAVFSWPLAWIPLVTACTKCRLEFDRHTSVASCAVRASLGL